MSRIGKKPIQIPEKTEVKIDGLIVSVKGPLGELSEKIHQDIDVKIADGVITTSPKKQSLETNAIWGTSTSLISNMIEGVTKGFEKKLIIEGVGFKFILAGSKLTLNVGFSHPIELTVPQGITVTEVEKNQISVKGINKQMVGEFAAVIRDYKRTEPYKGKGIRYSDEVIRRKEGKKTA